VIVSAPAAFPWTYGAMPERHHRVAALLTGDEGRRAGADALPDALTALMRDVGAPSGIAELGYDDDVPELVAGALEQQRLLVIAPKEPSPVDLEAIVRESMHNC
jgi:hydroxyacid-oxoacid transhydrogenase